MTNYLYAENEPNPNAGEIDLVALFAVFWRKKFMIFLMMLGGFMLALSLVMTVQPRYSAKALVLLNVDQGASIPAFLEGLARSGRFETSFQMGEVEIIRSRMMARIVVERLGLMNDPAFNPAASGAVEPEKPGFKTLSVFGRTGSQIKPEDEASLDMAVSKFLKLLVVRPVTGSSGIQVEFVSGDPEKAAKIANTVVDVYIEQRLEDKFREARRVTAWLEKRLEDLRQEVRQSEEAVQQFKKKHMMYDGDVSLMSSEQIAELNDQLIKARSKLAEAEVRLGQFEAVRNGDLDLASLSQVLDSPVIQRLKAEQDQLTREVSDLSSRYGARHPSMIQIQSELDELQHNIAAEMDLIMAGVEGDRDLSKARVENLQAEIASISGESFQDFETVITLRTLERESAAARVIYDKLLESTKGFDSKEELQEPQARVLSYAVPPNEPISPNVILITSLGGFLSLCLGMFLSIVMEKLDQTFRSASQIERALRIPCFAMIPQVPAMKSTADLSYYVIKHPASVVAEAVRTLRTVVTLRAGGRENKPKVLTMTSSFSGEGKSVLCTWIGRTAAQAGEKVILLDCDLRRPSIHSTLGQDHTLSLVDYLTGKASLEDVIQKDAASGMQIIFGRSVPNSALHLLGSERMRSLIEALRKKYDLVLIDSPASLAVSDARVLSTLSDLTLYGIGWAETPQQAVTHGVKQFTDIKVPVVTVLMNVDVSRQVRYGYGDSVYYDGQQAVPA